MPRQTNTSTNTGTAVSGLTLCPVPDGVASPDRRWLFLPGAEGGIDAIDAHTGGLHWHQPDALLALLADADRVLVLQPTTDNLWRPAWLRASDGCALAVTDPAATLPHLSGAAGRAWAITASCWHGGRLLLAWSARQHGLGQPSTAQGVLALDPEQLAQPAASSHWPAPPPGPVTGCTPFDDAGPPLPPWVVGDTVVVLAVDGSAGAARALLLLRPDGAAVLVDPLPAPGGLQALPSPDPSLVTLLRSLPAERAATDGSNAAQWQLFAAPDGSVLGVLPADDGLQPPFYRVGDVLLAVQLGALANKRARPGRQLRAWRLAASGVPAQPLWQRALPTASHQRLG